MKPFYELVSDVMKVAQEDKPVGKFRRSRIGKKRWGQTDVEQILAKMIKLSKGELAMYLLDESPIVRKAAELIIKDKSSSLLPTEETIEGE